MARKGKKKKTGGKVGPGDLEDEPREDAGEERLTPREAGIGFIVLGSILILCALIMPFVLGTTDQKVWDLGGLTLMFIILGLLSVGLGALLMNFRRLSRKL